MNMAATLFRLTVPECLAGVTREAARALGRLGEVGTLEAGKRCDLAIWDVERPAELVYGSAPIPSISASGTANDPGDHACPRSGRPRRLAVDLSRRRRRAGPASRAAVAAGARAVERIVARGEPVYGINTGFGKLASVRIPAPTSRLCSATSSVSMQPASASRSPPTGAAG